MDEDLIFSFPITTENGEWKIVPGLEISGFSKERIGQNEKELVGEREAIADLLK